MKRGRRGWRDEGLGEVGGMRGYGHPPPGSQWSLRGKTEDLKWRRGGGPRVKGGGNTLGVAQIPEKSPYPPPKYSVPDRSQFESPKLAHAQSSSSASQSARAAAQKNKPVRS